MKITEIRNLKEKRKRARKITQELRKLFPDAKIALKHSNHWELLVAVVLSAQCTDKKVNEVTEKYGSTIDLRDLKYMVVAELIMAASE